MTNIRGQVDVGLSGEAVLSIPTFGFARGAIVRHKHGTNHMLVIRGLDATTLCVVCEADHTGTVRMHEIATADLVQELPSAIDGADPSTRVRP